MEFGTGGLRGIIGDGDDRMNMETVGRTSQGLADYLNSVCDSSSVCIAYDTRLMSREFAIHAAQVFCANGILTYVYDGVRPTPMLSFAVRHHKTTAGVMITASHNPKEYNGYKVYGADGGQITDKAAASVQSYINLVDCVKTVSLEDTNLFLEIPKETDTLYYEKVKSLVIRNQMVSAKAGALEILYSPLHGTGNIPVRRVLRELGFSKVNVVTEQELPDGSFPTVEYPNPEEPSAFNLAVEIAGHTSPDLIFATDPDCDRIGVMAQDGNGDFSALSGNQIGVLLCDYILSSKRELGLLPANSAVVKTIVTTDLAKAICEQYGVTLIDTLTGFKYIGEKITQWNESGEYRFQFGFEESCGYLCGDFVRDKDAVVASVLVAELALYYKEQGLSLVQAMNRLYDRFGYTKEKLLSFSMPGQEGMTKITSALSYLRENYSQVFEGENIAFFEDYQQSMRHFPNGTEPIELPKSNVMKFVFFDRSWLVLRPSGTEPKLKLYVMARGPNSSAANARLEHIIALTRELIKV